LYIHHTIFSKKFQSFLNIFKKNFFSSEKQKPDEQDLKEQNQRHARHKFQMFCLMVKSKHTCQRSRRPSGYSQKQQRTFLDPPSALPRTPFIDSVDGKCDKIND